MEHSMDVPEANRPDRQLLDAACYTSNCNHVSDVNGILELREDTRDDVLISPFIPLPRAHC